MHYSEIKKYDIANGPGVRATLFVSGCRHHCPGCFNEMTWDFDYGTEFDEAAKETIFAQLSLPYVSGLTLLGGEPMEPENQKALLPFVQEVREKFPERTIWCYTGYVLEQDLLGEEPRHACLPDVTPAFLSCLDVLVDGPFVLAQKDISLRFRGSKNQRLIDMPATLKKGEVVLWDE